jgi:toxin ParE1/3/4
LRIEWTQPALADFIDIQEYIEEMDVHAAQVIGQRIWDASQQLSGQPKMGRIGYVEGTREWVVQKTPAILVYRIEAESIEILHVHHDRQNWQNP